MAAKAAAAEIGGMKLLFALAPVALLVACASVPGGSGVSAAPDGTMVGMAAPVQVGDWVVTPLKVLEDSRCPENARCIQAGRLVVEARIEGPGWRETVPLTLGEQHVSHGTVIALIGGVPERQANRETPAAAYRFAFEQRRQLPIARLGERVPVDGPELTPIEVLEDSRCPTGVQCVWAGRLRLLVTVHLGAGDQTRELVLGEPVQVADGMLELVEAWPQPAAGEAPSHADYRFTFRFDGGI